MERAHMASRTAYACLVLLVLTFLAFAIGAAFVTKDAAEVETQATLRNDFISAARYELGGEQSLHNRYLLDHSAHARQLHATFGRRIDTDLRSAREIADPDLRAAIDRLLSEHGRYTAQTHELFAAVDKRDIKRVRAIDEHIIDPAFEEMQAGFNAQVRRLSGHARTARIRLRETENAVIGLTLAVSIVAVIVLGIILAILRHYEKLVSATVRSEIDHLKRAALTDHLTGLGNHRAYQEDLARLAVDCDLRNGALTIAVIDIDEFKALNERRGHLTGDGVLTSLAALLRAGDPKSQPYRLRGDEFALVFSALPAPAVRSQLDHVRMLVETQLGGTTVSIGLATSNDVDSDPGVLRDQADSALYEAKRRGRNTVVGFDEIREEAAMFSPARLIEVRDLIAGGTMGVAFQPIWDSAAGRVLGYEALARPPGDHPINPQDAFDIAERMGKAHELDRICRAAVLASARTLPPDARLFLNVSPQSLDHGEFLGDALIDAVEAAGFSPSRVVLEITERSIARLPVVVREAKRLRRLGFALALDDAGAGNSGLEMLSQLAVDFVKIDRDVIVRAQSDVGGRAVLAGIIAIAHEMRAQVIAEGIEDAAMLELVRDATRWSTIPCALQGYYLGRPSSTFVDAQTLAIMGARLAPAVGSPIAHVRAF